MTFLLAALPERFYLEPGKTARRQWATPPETVRALNAGYNSKANVAPTAFDKRMAALFCHFCPSEASEFDEQDVEWSHLGCCSTDGVIRSNALKNFPDG